MSKRRIFEDHGVVFSGESEDQLIGRCPFSGKDSKFYVNHRTWLWDSKTAGLQGNVHTFLKLRAEQYQADLTDELLGKLARNRQLPRAAFAPLELGWDIQRKRYTMPIKDIDGRVVDIRTYRLNGSVRSTAGVKVGLWGSHTLKSAPADVVYICEGEWDAAVMCWLLKKSHAPGLVVAVPGAGTFRPEWVPWLSGRRVFVIYDNDQAGIDGEQVLVKRLYMNVQKMLYVHWPQDMPSGFDLRDWFISHKEEGAIAAYERLQKLIKAIPRVIPPPRTMNEDGEMEEAEAKSESVQPRVETRWKKPPTLPQVIEVFKKWLHLENTDAIRIMLACVVSQSMDGPPVWVFLVGPPGSAKTAILASLNTFARIYSTSSLTVHALISGANWKDTADPSLIPRLNGKVMVVKDFTSILSMRDAEKDEIFGILRDAYDGRCGKVFGNGVERNYISRFTILAAVTPKIYDMGGQHAALGERFLKFAVGDNLVHHSEAEIISRAIGNINQEGAMNDEFQDAVNEFLEHRVNSARIPAISKSIEKKIVALAMFGARMRGSVSRDTYRNEIMTGRPSAEIGSRLGIQLAKLAKALAMVEGKSQVTADEYRLLKKVILDTIPQRNEDIARTFAKLCKRPGSSTTTMQIAGATRYPSATIKRLLQDMHVLDIVQRSGSVLKFEWQLSKYMNECMTTAGLYQTEEEMSRKTRIWVRVLRKSKTMT